MADTSVLDSLISGQPQGGMPSTSALDELVKSKLPVQPQQSAQPQIGQLPDWAIRDRPSIAVTPSVSATPQQDEWSNIGGGALSGLYSGVAKAFNTPTHLFNAGQNVIHGLGSTIPPGSWQPPFNENPTGYQAKGPIARSVQGGSEAISNTAMLGALGKLATPFLPAGSTSQIASRTLSQTPPGMLAAAGAGGAAEEPVANLLPDELKPYGRMLANVAAGTLTGAAESGLKSFARGTIDPQAASIAQTSAGMGMPIRAGQVSGSKVIQGLDTLIGKLPLSGYANQQGQYTSLISHAFGADSSKLTPEIINSTYARLAPAFDTPADSMLQQNLGEIFHRSKIDNPDKSNEIRNTIINVLNSGINNKGIIPGSKYIELTRQGGILDTLQSDKGSIVSGLAGDVRNALDAAMERAAPPEELGALQEARNQYGAVETVRPIVKSGTVQPSDLMTRVYERYPEAANAGIGDIPLLDIARVGSQFPLETGGKGLFKWLTGAGEHLVTAGAVHLLEHGAALPHELPLHAMAAGATTLLGNRLAGAAAGSERFGNWMAAPYTAPDLLSRTVPLVTSAGVRELGQPPATNPTTGLPSYSLGANREAADVGPKTVARKLLNGSLADHPSTQRYIDQNKNPLRSRIGGQGIQRVQQIAALMRRAQSEPGEPSTVLSTLANGTPSKAIQAAVDDAGVKTPEDLLSLAISSPEVAKEFASRVGKDGISPLTERRLVAAIGQSKPSNVEPPQSNPVQ